MPIPLWLKSLFITRVPWPAPAAKGPGIGAAAGSGAAAAAATAVEAGSFITPPSLVTFPVAAAVIRVIWETAKAIAGPCAQTKLIPLFASLVVGAIIFLINLDASSTRPRHWRQWVVAVFIAFVNSLFLCAAALGIPIGADAGHAAPARQ